jgi:hypothetical protein
MRFLRLLRLSPPIVSIVSCDFLHGDLDVFGDIANIAIIASTFFHLLLGHFGQFGATKTFIERLKR